MVIDMATTPIRPETLTLRAYQVGFGDCFLLTFHYPQKGTKPAFDRHVLIDFGSTAKPVHAPKDLFLRVAHDIETECGGKLHAVVATHRHADHINCFARKKDGKGTGDIIRNLKPEVVVQPWTEDPDAQTDALTASDKNDPGQAFLRSLTNMNSFSLAVLEESRKLQGTLGVRRLDKLAFLGEDNLTNADAVENLMTMAKKNVYVYHGSRSGLEEVLPGVKIHVLGPPTLEQTDSIRKQRAKDQDEFWQLQAMAGDRHIINKTPLFPNAAAYKKAPPFARWFIPRMLEMQADQLLELVRILDDQMNNTSVILLFETSKQKLLFPGDAQIENWSYALKESPRTTEIRALLADVDLYKVGHHGSLNATPKSLWQLFDHKGPESKPDRLKTVVSTRSGKHGDPAKDTEVPRKTLVEALEKESKYYTTQDVKTKDLKETLQFVL
jgi:hypothetical protein